MAKCNKAYVFGVMSHHPDSYDYAQKVTHWMSQKGVRHFALPFPENMQSFMEDAIAAHRAGEPLGNIKFSSGDGFNTDADTLSKIVGLASVASERGMSVHCVGTPASMERKQRRKALLDEADQLPSRARADKIAEINSEDYKHEANRISQLEGKTMLLTGVLNVGGGGQSLARLREMGIDAEGIVLSPESGRTPASNAVGRRYIEVVQSQNPKPAVVGVSGKDKTVSPEQLADQLVGNSGKAGNMMSKMSERVSQILGSFSLGDGGRTVTQGNFRDVEETSVSKLPQIGESPAGTLDISQQSKIKPLGRALSTQLTSKSQDGRRL
jgi:hypothetical protein